MGATIKDIAKISGVSIATVSHVINKTRFVSQDLIDKVESAIKETGYIIKKHNGNEFFNKNREIYLLVPDISSRFFSVIAESIEKELEQKNYFLEIITYGKNKTREIQYLKKIIKMNKADGIIFVPYAVDATDLKELNFSKTPFLIIGNPLDGIDTDYVFSDSFNGIYLAATHLLKYGHEKIGLIKSVSDSNINSEQIKGYKKALEENYNEFDEDLILFIKDDYNSFKESFENFLQSEKNLTAVICTSMKLTLYVLNFMLEKGIECPKNLSVVGYDNYELGNIFNPSLTSISQFPDKIAKVAADLLLKKMSGQAHETTLNMIPVKLNVRESTQIIGRGPFGERSEYPESLYLTETEIEQVRNGDYKAAIAFHYSGKAWMRLVESGIRDIFNKLNIKIISVTDAHFDASLQRRQLDGLLFQEPDIIISIPCDDILTADSYKNICDSNTKLILINNVPQGLSPDDYVTCVSINEREMGYNAGKLLGEYFKNQENVEIGLLRHGATFYGTKQRDSAAEQVLREEYRNIKITAVDNFFKEDMAYDVCLKMIKENPRIKGMFITWDGPALKAIDALTDAGREDIAIVTCDLDIEVAINMARGKMIKGISAQRPYEQGVSMAFAAANAFLGKKVASFIGVKPYIVSPNNLSKAWKEIIKEKEPESLLAAMIG